MTVLWPSGAELAVWIAIACIALAGWFMWTTRR
jgi:hypothetical protein